MTCYLSSDSRMYEAYNNKKDLYAMIAQSAYDNEYWENLEFYPEGTEVEIDGKKIITGHKTHLNKDGKARRSIGKVLLLASTYGMSGATAGSRMNKTAAEGEELLNKFFNTYTGVKNEIEASKKSLYEKGYVEDFLGRKRRLEAASLAPYVVKHKEQNLDTNFNPFINCKNREDTDDYKIAYWQNEVNKAIESYNESKKKFAIKDGKEFTYKAEMGNKKFKELAAKALEDGIIISANTGRIAQAERQCFNARIQGSAASLTKLAMVDIHNDKQLNDWDAHLIITVHDEVLVEGKAFYADDIASRLVEVMCSAAAKQGDDVPQSCDPYIVDRWYADTIVATIQSDFKKLCDKYENKDEAMEVLYKKYSEFPMGSIRLVATGESDELIFD